MLKVKQKSLKDEIADRASESEAVWIAVDAYLRSGRNNSDMQLLKSRLDEAHEQATVEVCQKPPKDEEDYYEEHA